MPALHPDLEAAITEVLDKQAEQSVEFKRRLRQLIVNGTSGEVPDSDTRDIIQLAIVTDTEDEQ